MKFFASVLVASTFIVSTFAQNITIGEPKEGSTIYAGSSLIVEVDRPDTLTGSTEVAVVIAINSCPADTGCPDPSQNLGTILYNGTYTPEFRNDTGGINAPPHENFNTTIPATLAKGTAILNVVHLSLVGAGAWPLYEIKSAKLNVD